MPIAEKEYTVHLYDKNRFDDLLISRAVLKQIKRSLSNMKKGAVSAPIDIKAARKALRSLKMESSFEELKV